MPKKVLMIVICLLFMPVCFAEGEQSSAEAAANAYQNIQYENCTKMYNVDKNKLFYLAIGAVNSNKYKLEEIQTSNGYIVFSKGKNKYILTVAGIDKENSVLKITPCNNLYYFQPVILTSIFEYVDTNKDTAIE
jgi:hypothetical protein